ncbi:hypothetical protein [Amycolatopsis australiensis]|nr:hypothetical protein [Amycolatopsis australiensis]
MTTFRAGFLVLATVVAVLDAGFWLFARAEHQTTARSPRRWAGGTATG